MFEVFQPLGRRVQLGLALVLLSITSLVAAQGSTVSIKHAAGEMLVKPNPAKVIVLDLAVLDIMHALGVTVAGVPNGRFPDHMAMYGHDNYRKVGTLFEPDFEAINEVSPDLILVGRRSAKNYPELAKVAPTMDLSFDQQHLMDSVARNTRTLASIYRKEDKAEALLAKLDRSVKELNAEASKAGRGLLVFTTNGKMIAQGPDSRFGVLHKEFGVRPAITDFPGNGKGLPLTPELIGNANPDWIYVIDRDAGIRREGPSAQQLLNDELVHSTAAGKKNQIVYLDPANWYLLDGAGLATVQANVDQILKALRGQQ